MCSRTSTFSQEFCPNRIYVTNGVIVFIAHKISRRLVCLNSALNPLIYLHVNEDIAAQIRQLFEQVRQIFNRLFLSNTGHVPVAQNVDEVWQDLRFWQKLFRANSSNMCYWEFVMQLDIRFVNQLYITACGVNRLRFQWNCPLCVFFSVWSTLLFYTLNFFIFIFVSHTDKCFK